MRVSEGFCRGSVEYVGLRLFTIVGMSPYRGFRRRMRLCVFIVRAYEIFALYIRESERVRANEWKCNLRNTKYIHAGGVSSI